MEKRGLLRSIYGSMFGGKTRTLITFGKHAKEAHKHVLGFNHAWDDRYGDNGDITSHDKDKFSAIKVKNTLEIYQNLEAYVKKQSIKDLAEIELLINEAQFFDPMLVDFCKEYKRFMHINIAFLDKDYMERPFKFPGSNTTVSELVALADEKIHRKGKCMNVDLEHGYLKRCGNNAEYTQMLDLEGNTITTDIIPKKKNKEAHIVVGGGKSEQKEKKTNYYEARCEECFVRPKEKSKFPLKDLVYVP